MEGPQYVIAAAVPQGNRVRQFHRSAPESVARYLMSMPRIRSGSFDVAIPGEAEDGPDNSIELRWPGRKLLRLYQDGTLIFRGAADHDFLGWAEPSRFQRFPALNPVAVVEVHVSFALLYQHILTRLKDAPAKVDFKLTLKHGWWEGGCLLMTQYYARGIQNVVSPPTWPIGSDPAEEALTAPPSELERTPQRTAYRLVEAFVSMFDMPADNIPFTRDTSAGPEVDIEQIKRL